MLTDHRRTSCSDSGEIRFEDVDEAGAKTTKEGGVRFVKESDRRFCRPLSSRLSVLDCIRTRLIASVGEIERVNNHELGCACDMQSKEEWTVC